ncbi:conserved protein, unknown function [Hepatocystis sp. ex Piliocolobus tephrosceles]|nr:conserved protein, unknown function [Hepatocystis sp. ex Piliocolobus tephrosceles]
MNIFTRNKRRSLVLKLLLVICIIRNVYFFLNNSNNKNKTKRSSSFYVDGYSWKIFDSWKSIKQIDKINYKLTYNLGLKIDAEIGEFGDYNSDVKTDLILFKYDKNKKQSTIYVHIFDAVTNKFVYFTKVSFEGIIVNITAIDLNFDGSLDILVLFKDVDDTDPNSKKNYICAFIQNEQDDTLVEIWNSKKKEKENESIAYVEDGESFYYTNIHPLVCDINNDGMPDMIAQVVTGDTNIVNRFLYINTKTGFKTISWDNMPNLFEYKEYKEISYPNSSAIVDIDGDCKADLVFTVYDNVVSDRKSKGIKEPNTKQIYLEIWLNKIINGKSVYINSNKYYKLPNNSLQVLFGDFNADGSIDLVVPTCEKQSSCNYCCVQNDEIYFIPNIQKKICDSTWKQLDETKCRPADKLCSASEYEFVENLTPQYITTIDTTGLHFAGNVDYPYYLSVGDVDNDGYLDLLIVLKNANNDKYVRIYKSERRLYDLEKNVEIRDFFDYYDFVLHNKPEVNIDIYNAAFFDIYENGVLDILIFGKLRNNDQKVKYHAVSFIRNNETDSLFLKTTALNGICVRDCYKDKNKINTKIFGNNSHGPTFKITVVDINGVKTSKIGTQKSQSAHLPLQLPYVIFGLSRTSNYVEEFYAGMPTHEKNYFNKWVSIIPNSHIIVIPHPLNNSNNWQIQLSVSPSNKFYSIIYITLICLTVIGIIIFILDRKEKIQDSQEERGFKSYFVIG